jgi:hypothetical protein
MTVRYVDGKDVVAIPQDVYWAEFRKDPRGALLDYGSLPQRARMPYFTDVAAIDAAMVLPDQVVGALSEHMDPDLEYRALVASSDPLSLIGGLAESFRAWDAGYWHVAVDLALNVERRTDAAGIAMGRVARYAEETSKDPMMNGYSRIVREFEIPLVAQIIAPVGSQVFIGSIGRFILQLKQLRGFNITSFSFDGFQSSDVTQQLVLAGLVTAGMTFDKYSGEVVGLPKKFSVDGKNTQPYREVLEALNEERVRLPRYALLRQEMRQLETLGPGLAPDHPQSGSKDCADPVAGVMGYLSVHGHAELDWGESEVIDRDDVAAGEQIEADTVFGVDDDMEWGLDPEAGAAQLAFGVE